MALVTNYHLLPLWLISLFYWSSFQCSARSTLFIPVNLLHSDMYMGICTQMLILRYLWKKETEEKVMHFTVGCSRRAVGCLPWPPLWLTQQDQRSPTCIILVTPERLWSACTLGRGRKGILLNQHTNLSDRKLFWGLWVPHPWLRAFSIGSILTSNHSTGKSPYSCSRKLSLENGV